MTNYLCFKYLSTKSGHFLDKIAKSNKSILLLNTLSIIPPLSIPSKKTKMVITQMQNLIFISYVKNITVAPYCSFRDKIKVLKNNPYGSSYGFLPSRVPDGTMKLRKKKWAIRVFNQNLSSSLISSSFSLKGLFEIKSKFNSVIKFTSVEIPMPVLWSWKRPFGE